MPFLPHNQQHQSTNGHKFLQASGCPACHPTNSDNALKEYTVCDITSNNIKINKLHKTDHSTIPNVIKEQLKIHTTVERLHAIS